MPSHLDLNLSSFFDRFLLPTATPCTFKIIVFHLEKYSFFNKFVFEVQSIYGPILVPTWLLFSSLKSQKFRKKNEAKNDQNFDGSWDRFFQDFSEFEEV